MGFENGTTSLPSHLLVSGVTESWRGSVQSFVLTGSKVTNRCNDRERRSFPVPPFFFLGLIAVVVFVLGPQAGSLDDNGDGAPDVPIVVMTSGSVSRPPETVGSSALQPSILAPIVSDEPEDAVCRASRFLACEKYPPLCLLCSLRCWSPRPVSPLFIVALAIGSRRGEIW